MRLARVLASITVLLVLTANADQHPNAVKGFKPEGVYQLNGLDNINAFNGNLTLSIPLGQPYPIGGGLQYQLRLYANGNIWDSENRIDLMDELDGKEGGDCRQEGTWIPTPCTQAYPERRSNAGVGWMLSLGRIFPAPEPTNGGATWLYESPDGAEHHLFKTLHEGLPDDAPETLFTRDGTYIRVRFFTGGADVEFPNGEVHTFEDKGDFAPWTLVKISNRFTANVLNVTYESGTEPAPENRRYVDWILSDGHRTHRVRFHEYAFETGIQEEWADDPPMVNTRMLVRYVDVAAFGGTVARYSFSYSDRDLHRPDWHTVPEPYSPLFAHVQVLDRIQLPDGTSYGFEYFQAYPHAGLPRAMTMPTGGRIEWTYAMYQFPSWTAPSAPHMSQSSGVATRRVYDRAGHYAEWTYTQSLDRSWNDPNPDWPTESKTVIRDPDGNTTEQYFDVSSLNSGGISYGLPFTPNAKDATNTRFLSTRVYARGETSPRSTYVRYEKDATSAAPIVPGDRRNSRQKSSRTVFEDLRWFDIDHDDYDGFGHYRVKRETGDGVTRTTTTNYNAGRGSYGTAGPWVMIPASSPWITEAYDSVVVSKGTESDRTEFCFDTNTGFLLRKRVVRGTPVLPVNDLYVIYDPDVRGNVARERHYGGDHAPLPDSVTCSTTLGTPEFDIRHDYEAGALKRSYYPALGNFETLDLTIDASTATASASRDVSDLETSYRFDAMGRLTELRPPGMAWTSYVYPAPNAAMPVSVTASQWPEGQANSGTPLMESRYFYDGLGRFIQESRRVPVGWSITRTDYDVMNRRTAAYAPFHASTSDYVTTPSTQSSRWTYDGHGRVTTVTQADGSTTTVAYPSTRVTRTTASIQTTASGQELVTTEEERDAFGRLVRVTEDAGGALSATTNYGYTLDDKLTTVTMGEQLRTFTYDGAGFLRREQHPESGITDMTYDSRGHVRSRSTAMDSLTYQYDAAERLRNVFDDGLPLKEFAFYTSGIGKGKLERATRFNRYYPAAVHNENSPRETITVSEFFQYGDNGQISAKRTEISPRGGTFHDSYAYDALGKLNAVGYPSCSTCTGLTAPLRSVSTSRVYGLATAVNKYANAIEYHPNGMLKSMTHLNVDQSAGPVYKQEADGGMPRPSRIEVSNVCNALSIATHPESRTVNAGEPVPLNAAANGVVSWRWFERTASGDVPIAGQTSASLTVTAGNNVTRSYFARAIGTGTCSADTAVANVTGVSSCAIDTRITVSDPVDAGGTMVASVPPTTGATYQWTVSGGTISGSSTGSTISFIPSCTVDTVTLAVTVTAGCEAKNNRVVAVRRPAADVTGSTTISSGESATLRVTLTGVGPWTVTWQDNILPPRQTTSPEFEVTVSPSATTVYAISTVTANGCTVANGGSQATVTVSAPCTTLPNMSPPGVADRYVASVPYSFRMWDEPGQTYEWSITNGRITFNDGLGYVRFVTGCSGTFQVSVKVTSKCGYSDTWSISRPIEPASVAIAPESTSLVYVPGGPAVPINVNISGAYHLTATWSDGLVERTGVGPAGGTYTRHVTPATTTQYRIVESVDAMGACSPQAAGVATVTVCNRPDVTITAPATVTSKAVASASVTATPGATYQWIVDSGGTIVGAANAATVNFVSTSCSGAVVLRVTVTPSCGIAARTTSAPKSITVVAPSAVVSGETTVSQGSGATIQAALSGVAPWQVRWEDQTTATSVSASPHRRTVTPLGTTTYRLASVVDGGGCAATLIGAAQVTVLPPVPSNVVATALTATSVRITWSYAGTADEFEIYRGAALIGRTGALQFDDLSAQGNTAYLYRVLAVKSQTSSALSAPDVATTVLFGSDIVSGSTVMTADHIVKLRAAVNALRMLSGLQPATFTDADSVLNTSPPRAVHIVQLQQALAEARVRLGLTGSGDSGRNLAAGAQIFAGDVMELRRGVQ